MIGLAPVVNSYTIVEDSDMKSNIIASLTSGVNAVNAGSFYSDEIFIGADEILFKTVDKIKLTIQHKELDLRKPEDNTPF